MSGQQIGSVVGGVVGAFVGGYFGNPQFGYAIGSAIGGAIGGYVDPTVIKGPKLTDATQQTASDGIPIPWGDGTFPTAGNIIWTTQLTERAKEDDGKGTGVVNVTYHYYRSFAIGICQGIRQTDGTYLPIEGILQVKKNGKVVYDVTPGIDHDQAAQNAKFMRNTRFYLGSETQLPDSVIESYMGIGDTPAYPGTVYMVRDNVELTETSGAIEQYEFVVSICGDTANFDDNIYPFNFVASGSTRAYIGGESGAEWDQDGGTGTGSSFVRILDERVLLFHPSNLRYTDDYFATHSTFSAPWTTMVVPPVVCSSGRIYVAEPASESVHYSDDRGETWTTVDISYDCDIIAGDDSLLVVGSKTDETYRISTSGLAGFGTAVPFNGLQAISYGDGMFIITEVLSATAYWSEDGLSTLHPVGLPSPGGDPLENYMMFRTSSGAWLAVNRASSNTTSTLIARSPDGKQDFEYITTPPASMNSGNVDSRFAEFDGSIVCVAQTDTTLFVPLLSNDDGLTWTAITHGMSGFTVNEATSVASVVSIGNPIPDAPGFYVTPQGQIIGGSWTEITRCKPTIGDIVASACLRSGLVVDDYDVSELTDEIDGFKIATETSAEAIISPLMAGWFFDAGEWDDKIRFPKRGQDVVAELTVDDLCESDGDVIEETELQEAELLSKVHIRTIDPAAGFTVTTQTAERRTSTVLAKGEQTTEIPVVTDKDTQARMADKKLKVGWSETRRFKTCIPYTRPDLTVTDVIGLTDNKGKRQRVRLMEMAEDSGRIEIREAMLDRQSSYTSNVEGTSHGAPTSTSPGLIGPTFGVPMNLPRLRSGDIGPGAYLAACGYLRGWSGCAVLLSADDGVSYQQVTQFTEPSSMGVLHAAITSSSEPIEVFMNSGTLSSITVDQIALRMNAFAITTSMVSELGQFQTSVLGTSDIYDLTETIRGALGTTPVSHNAGDPFVMVASTQFLPLDIALAGRTLYFKFVSFGTSPDDASPIPFLFDPQFFGAPVIEPYTDDADNVYTDSSDNIYYYEVS